MDWLAEVGGVSGHQLRTHAYVLEGARRRPPRLPRRQRARFDGARRAADPRPDEAGGARGRHRRHAGHARCTSCSSARSRSPRKCARSTEIGAHSISMAAAAVRLAAQLFEDLREIKVLFVGAGEMIELAATHFAARTPKPHGRRQPHARARREAGRRASAPRRCAWPTCPARLAEFDVVVSCTASSLPHHRPRRGRARAEGAPHRPMFMVDLAVPRDIEPEVDALADVYLYTVDDLVGAGADRQARSARRRSRRPRPSSTTGVQSFVHWLDQRGTVPLIQALQRARPTTGARRDRRARASCWPRARTSTRCWKRSSRGLTQKMLHGALAELHAADGEQRARSWRRRVSRAVPAPRARQPRRPTTSVSATRCAAAACAAPLAARLVHRCLAACPHEDTPSASSSSASRMRLARARRHARRPDGRRADMTALPRR